MRGLAADVVALIMRFADGQRGLIRHAQLLQCGLDRYAIKRLRERGWLRPVTRGVYLVGHNAAVPYVRETAAVLAFAPDAIIVHRSSLVVWKACEPNEQLPVHVAVPGRRPTPRQGFVIHHPTTLDPCDIGRCERLKVTKPARALLESACDLGRHETEKAVDEAIALGLVTRPALLNTIDRYPGHRGAAILRTLADPNNASEITESEAEAALARLLRRAKAPPSITQYRVGPYRADRAWPVLHLIIEVDGSVHRDPKRMESDNRRTDYLRRHGWTVIRFTRRQIVYEPEHVLLQIGQELALATYAATARANPATSPMLAR
jgi:very-short-patch-repair endonuclease